jgi:tetratricopeptide (TPR) repeat protein
MNRILSLAGIVLLVAAVGTSPAGAQDKYKNFDDAMSQGARLIRDMQFAAAQEPLEAAVKLAPDDKSRLRAYQALVPAYRLLPEIDKMLQAQEFILRHTPQRAGRSLAARSLASFLHQRGKTDLAVERYEKALAADPKDVAALAVLTTIFTQIKRDRQRGPELTAKLESLDRELAAKHAAQLEADAETAPRTAASIYKDAATAWIEAGDKAQALAAVKKSLASLPEERGGQLVYHWRRGLGDALLAAGEPAQANEQYEAALADVTIDGYRKDTEKQLAEAKAAAKQP